MKKILCLVIAIILMLTCVGCSGGKIADKNKDSLSGRFYTVADGNHDGDPVKIIIDRETNVMYLKHWYGITVMFDADGKPLLWEG